MKTKFFLNGARWFERKDVEYNNGKEQEIDVHLSFRSEGDTSELKDVDILRAIYENNYTIKL
jgi:hypothetical protein